MRSIAEKGSHFVTDWIYPFGQGGLINTWDRQTEESLMEKGYTRSEAILLKDAYGSGQDD